MESLAYKRNIDDTISRLSALYNREMPDHICASFEIPSPALETFRAANEEGFCPAPDIGERISFWDGYLAERAALEDDGMPCAYLSECDQGLYGAMVGGEIQYMCHDNGWISSMVPPLLGDWARFDDLTYDETLLVFREYLERLCTFRDGSAGKFGVSHFILIDGINFVFELVGATEAYMSMIERPDTVRRAISFAYDLNRFVQDAFFAETGLFRGGTFSNFAQWLPGRIVSESVDPFHMTSIDYFEEWGRANIERMFASYDGGVVHLHANGRHLLEAVSTLPGLKAILMLDDVGYERACDCVTQFRKRAGNVPLSVYMPYADFADRLDRHDLSGGIMYQVTGTPNANAANRLMEDVRKYVI